MVDLLVLYTMTAVVKTVHGTMVETRKLHL